MSVEKNITMRQFNGTDYDTLYPKTDVKQIENLTPSSIGAVAKSGDTMTGDLYFPDGKKLWFYTSGTVGYYLKKDSNSLGVYDQDGHLLLGFNYNGKPVAFGGNRIVTADEMVGVPKIAIGSYVGTGTAGQGQSTATVLTFNFAPKFLILVQDEGALPNGTTLLSRVGAYSIYGYSGFYHFYTYSSGFACKLLGWGTNTLSYYTNGADATYQFNASGKTYYYMALG